MIEDAPVIRYERYTPEKIDADSFKERLFKIDKNGNEKFCYDEGIIAEIYKKQENLRFYRGQFYTTRGVTDIDSIEKDIYDTIKPFVKSGLAAKTQAIRKCLEKEAYDGPLNVDASLIPCANGEIIVGYREWTFINNIKFHVPYRLPISFPDFHEEFESEMFHKWLNDLFTPEDQLTLQEYLGYCLLPTTAGQKSLFLIGDAGTGKSRIGTVLEILLGDALINPPVLSSFLDDKFKVAELENKLVLYDDDLDDAALKQSGLFKKLVTNSAKIMVERKYENPFNITPYTRFVASGNTMLSAMYDRTDGFSRRLLPLQVLPKDPDRVVIPNLDRFFEREANGIMQWALIGLSRLMDNGWRFTVSKRTEDFMGKEKAMINHYPEFLETCFTFGSGKVATSKEITTAYRQWCEANSVDMTRPRALQKWLTDNSEKYDLEYSNHIMAGDRQLRGYIGMEVRREWKVSPGMIPI